MTVRATDPRACDHEIYARGRGVCIADGDGADIERWVRMIAKIADAKVDWYFVGNLANVLHLGDEESRRRVLAVIHENIHEFPGCITSIDSPSLPRNGVNDPEEESIVYRDGNRLGLDDASALAMARVIAKENCHNTFEMNEDRIRHFKQRVIERGNSADQVVIVIVNVDDVHGGPIADSLMPGYDWQQFRDKGEIPFARGLADRDGMQEILEHLDEDAAKKLKDMILLAVVVIDHGTAEVFFA